MNYSIVKNLDYDTYKYFFNHDFIDIWPWDIMYDDNQAVVIIRELFHPSVTRNSRRLNYMLISSIAADALVLKQ